ncbi:MAG: type II toxin-antitoxin system RelE/ParE family toxin [Synergistaceae bacterium]|nr:type II toxin-antitoxin system RelE/ParE family toxin [Synergistaceae bacterium]
MKVIEYSKQAQKFLMKQNAQTRERIISAIEKIPEGKGDIKKMEGQPGWRLRVGIYRVIFDDLGNVILIYRIKPRGEVYKGGERK